MTAPNQPKNKLIPAHDPTRVYAVTMPDGSAEQLLNGHLHKVGDKLYAVDDPTDPRRWTISAIDHDAKTCTVEKRKI